MSNTIGLTIDGVQVASATVSSLANLEALLTADPVFGYVETTVNVPAVMAPDSVTVITPAGTAVQRNPVASPLDAVKAWVTAALAGKIAEADAVALAKAQAAALAAVTITPTTLG
jgi:hypothetical protein